MKAIGLFLVFFILGVIDAQNRCSNNQACVNIRDCPSILSILRGPRPLSEQSLQIIRDSQCGFQGNDPKVCCANQQLPPSSLPSPSPLSPQVNPQTDDDEPSPPDVTNHINLRLLDHEICGPITQRKLIGGNKTSIIEFPWMALIAYQTPRGREFRCGGTIISSRYILTAAHCVTMLPGGLRLIGVRVGDHDISKEVDCDYDENGFQVLCAEKYQDFGVESIHFHSGYTTSKLQNDIAIIRVNDTIDFRPDTVKPICLPYGSGTRLSQKKAIVTGWGATENGPRSQDLLQARMPLMTNEQCQNVFKRTVQIWYKQMCAGGVEMVDSCMGDSGGPLQAPGIYNNDKIRTIQYGVVSYGLKNCGTAGFPGVYTRIAYYIDWILDTMRD